MTRLMKNSGVKLLLEFNKACHIFSHLGPFIPDILCQDDLFVPDTPMYSVWFFGGILTLVLSELVFAGGLKLRSKVTKINQTKDDN